MTKLDHLDLQLIVQFGALKENIDRLLESYHCNPDNNWILEQLQQLIPIASGVLDCRITLVEAREEKPEIIANVVAPLKSIQEDMLQLLKSIEASRSMSSH